jgi:transcriptional regulator with XRE-family HTH domain
MSVETSGELIDLSLNIRRLREEKGWSTRELAKRVGTSHPAIIRWEKPVPSMTLESLDKLADVFGVKIRDLFEPLGEKRCITTTIKKRPPGKIDKGFLVED